MEDWAFSWRKAGKVMMVLDWGGGVVYHGTLANKIFRCQSMLTKAFQITASNPTTPP